MKRMFVVMFAFVGLASSRTATALQCPSFPEQVAKDWQVEVNTTVARIGPVKGGELATKVQSATQDLLGKLPEGSRLYLEQMMYASYCSALKDDRSLSETEKGQRLTEYNREVRRVLQASPSPPVCQGEVSPAGEGPRPGGRGFLSVGHSKVFLGFMTDTSSTKYPFDHAGLASVVSRATAKGSSIDKGEIQTHVQGSEWYSYGLADKAILILYAYDNTAQRRSWIAIRRDGDVFELRWSGSQEVHRLDDCFPYDRSLMGNPHVQVSVVENDTKLFSSLV